MNKQRDFAEFCGFPIPTFENWQEIVKRSIKGASIEEMLYTKKYDGFSIQPMYQQKDVPNSLIGANMPGQFPFTRGTTDRKNAWLISQELFEETPKKVNELAKEAFKQGQMVFHFSYEKGAYHHKKTFLELFEGIKITKQPLHLYAGVECLLPLAGILSAIKNKEEKLSELQGIIGADPLSELAQKGKIDLDFSTVYDHMATSIKVTKEATQLKTILVQSHVYHNGGASASDELAFALATGVEYVSEIVERGIEPDMAGKAIAFSLSIGSDLFTEIAKLRSARSLWAAIMKEFGASEEGQKLFIHARTSSFTKTKFQPYVNILRGTSEAYAAIIGGADSIQVSPFDEVIGQPTKFSQRIARNTLLILKEEAHISQIIDPLGGSWYVERLTELIAQKAWTQFQRIENVGGMSKALAKGIPQQWVEQTWKMRKADVEHQCQIIVGVNDYVSDENVDIKQRADTKASRLLDNEGGSEKIELDIFEKIVAFIEQGGAFQTAYQILRNKRKNSIKIRKILKRRMAESFEELLDASIDFQVRFGKKPNVLLVGRSQARIQFASKFFQSGGFEIAVLKEKDILEQINAHDIFVVCEDDKECLSTVTLLFEKLSRLKKESRMYVTEIVDKGLVGSLRKIGVKDSITNKSNTYQLLKELHHWKGVRNDEKA